jgi:peptidoglycan/LPS O-acetylase OafA/YrhL
MARDQRIASLDGLRGLAAAAVVYAHIEYFYPSTNPWISLDTGDAAVAIFFSLSGFLMAILYGDRRFDAWDYLVHRFARIYPVYLAAVLVTIGLSAVYGSAYLYPIAGTEQIVRHVVMAGSSGIFWSIPPEIQFYLYFLLIWLWFGNPQKYQWVAVASAAVLIVCSHFDFPGPGILLTSKLPYFLFGTLAGRLYTRQPEVTASAFTGLVTLALLVFFFIGRGFFPLAGSFWGLSSALTGAIIVYFVACQSPVSASVLGARPLVFLGKISFSLYLFHLPVLFLGSYYLKPYLPPEARLLISILAAVVVAWVSFRTIEDPSRRLLTGLWQGKGSRLAVAAE